MATWPSRDELLEHFAQACQALGDCEIIVPVCLLLYFSSFALSQLAGIIRVWTHPIHPTGDERLKLRDRHYTHSAYLRVLKIWGGVLFPFIFLPVPFPFR